MGADDEKKVIDLTKRLKNRQGRQAKASATVDPLAAIATGLGEDGVALRMPVDACRRYVVQVAAFKVEDRAITLCDKLRDAGFAAHVQKGQTKNSTLWRVRVGPEADRDVADHLRVELSTKMNLRGMVVAYQ